MVNTLHSPFNYWLLSQLPQLNCFSKEKREHKTTHDRYRFYLYWTTFIKIISLLFSFLMFLHGEFHSLFHILTKVFQNIYNRKKCLMYISHVISNILEFHWHSSETRFSWICIFKKIQTNLNMYIVHTISQNFVYLYIFL